MIKVYSHPRSGTNLLAAYVAKNFYPNEQTLLAPVRWGHWADRRFKPSGNPYGKLIGNHKFPNSIRIPPEAIYIKRCGEAVAYSLWKSEGFTNPNRPMSLKQFLRTPLDWWGSPSLSTPKGVTIDLHWKAHVAQWEEETDVLHVRYEDLVAEPEKAMLKIRDRFGLDWNGFVPVEKMIGYSPNTGTVDEWKKHFDEEDRKIFHD